MNLDESFTVLGIERTKDKGMIKTAYRALLSQNNPEDHPEEFKRLRQAYETAVKYADSREEDAPEKETDVEDATPSGRIAAEFKSIYANMEMRRNPAVFEEFFNKDIFYYLGEDELCRKEILVFMMSHYYFPTAVWKILDVKLRISAGEKELKETFPADYINFLIAKCNNGEEVNFDQFVGPADADYDGFIHCTERIYQALREEKLEDAAKHLETAEQMGIYNPVLDLSRAVILKQTGRAAEGLAVLKALYEKYPEDEVAWYNYAEALWSEGEKDDAAVIYLKLKKNNDKHYMSNVRLTEWYYERQEYETAKKHAYCVIKFGCDDKFRDLLRRINDNLEVKYIENIKKNNNYKDKMELCWCYLQSEKLLECIKLAKTIKDEVEDKDRTEYIGMMAKIYVECGSFSQAVPFAKGWLEALKREKPEEYKSKIHTAHYLLAECYHFMASQDNKLFEQAAKELEEIGEDLQQEYGFLIKLAYIYADAANIRECERIAQQLEKKRIYIGHNILLEAYLRAGDARGVIAQSKVVLRYFPDMPRPYELAAKAFYDYASKEGLKDVLELAKKNGVQTDILNAYQSLCDREDRPDGEQLTERIKKIREGSIRRFRESGDEEDFEKALDELNLCFNDYPGSFLLVERGLLYLAAKKYDEARRDFEKAVEDNLYNRYAWNNLGCVYLEQGLYDKAFTCFNKSVCASGGEYMLAYANIADCYDGACQYEEEEQQYQLLMQKFNRKDVDYYSSLMEVYKNLGKWEEARRLALQYGGTQIKYYQEILGVALEMGRMKEAENIVRQWSKLFGLWNKKDMTFYRETSWYYLLAGKPEMAVREMEKAVKIEGETAGNSWKRLELYEEILFMMYVGAADKSRLPDSAKKYAKKINEIKAQGKINFQKKKYFLYVYNLAEIVLENKNNAQILFELLEKCPRCGRCTMADCKELLIAKGMMLDLQGRDGAAEIYEKLFRKYPCDKYIIALHKYKTR